MPNQPITNSFGLRGQGQLIVDDEFLTFAGERSGFRRGGPPKLARADVANCDYGAEKGVVLIRTRSSDDFVMLWATSREDADAIWALLPHEKTPEFLSEQQHFKRYDSTMAELGRRAPVTPTLIALNAILFLLMLAAGADFLQPDSELLIRFGSNYGPLTWTGQEWRLLTSAFLHAGILHIALNMFALYQGGALVERLYGSTRFVLIYLLSALAGSVASVWWEPVRNSVGASGAIFGVYGALLAFFALRRADFPRQLWKSVGTSALMMMGYSLAVGAAHPYIDNTAHIGGLLGGMVSGALLVRPFDISARKKPQPLKLALTAALVLLPLAWLAWPLANGAAADAFRFQNDFLAFEAPDKELGKRAAAILTPDAAAPIDGAALAARLRREALQPWREATRPLMQGPTLPENARDFRLQLAIREYIRAKDRAFSLRAQALETGDPAVVAEADRAWEELDAAARRVEES